MRYLANAFSIQMIEDLTSLTNLCVRPIGSGAVKVALKNGATSCIGHADLATVLTDTLDQEVAVNRCNISLTPEDTLYVAQLVGGRLPEGSTSLPEGFEIQFFIVTLDKGLQEYTEPFAENSIYGAIRRRGDALAKEFGGECHNMADPMGNFVAEVVAPGFHATLHDD